MANQYWKVTRAFVGTVQGDKTTPEVVNSKAGPCHKYVFQVEDQPVNGWLNILRKIDENGNSKPLEVGDSVYGDVVENNWGKAQFDRAQPPQEGQATQAPRPAAQAPKQASGELEAKVDYLISLVENFLDSQKGTQPAGADKSPASDDSDEKPVDLTELDY